MRCVARPGTSSTSIQPLANGRPELYSEGLQGNLRVGLRVTSSVLPIYSEHRLQLRHVCIVACDASPDPERLQPASKPSQTDLDRPELSSEGLQGNLRVGLRVTGSVLFINSEHRLQLQHVCIVECDATPDPERLQPASKPSQTVGWSYIRRGSRETTEWASE